MAGKLVPQRPVRIHSNDGTTTRTYWVGWVENIEPAVGRYGKRTVRITAMGAMQFLKASETKLPLQVDRPTDQIIGDLIKEVVMPPALNRAWILGRVGNSEVGVSMVLADTSAYSALESGKLKLGMAGDNWVIQNAASDARKSTFDVYRAISDVVTAEGGKFFFDREGRAVFYNRHRFLLGGTPLTMVDDTMTGMEYSCGGRDYLKNELTVICHPRTISSAGNLLLWQLPEGSAITIPAGKTNDLYIKFEDEDGNRVGGRDVYVDLATLTFEEGVAAITVTPSANGAELKCANTGASDAVITKLEIRGRKIVDSGEIEVTSLDSGSIIDFGRRTLRMNMPSLDNAQQAQYISDFERDRRKAPKGMVEAVMLKSHGVRGGGLHAQQLMRTIGDLIRVEETQSGHEGDYYIIGESHELTHGATLWQTTWYLEPAPQQTALPWRLGVAGRTELGAVTRLSY